MSNVVCCFDIGIKNLSYCIFNSDTKKILGCKNYSLLEDSDAKDVKQKYSCVICGKNGLYTFNEKDYCTKHTLKPIFKDLSGNVLKKMPTVSVLKEITKQSGKKEELYEYVKKNYALPIVKKKATKKAFDMESLHFSVRKFVLDHKTELSLASVIGLENQPVLKNPVMKTVQCFLYSCLKNILDPSPKMKLIHAGKKVKGKEVGEAGYKDRKQGSIERTKEFLKKHTQEQRFHELFHTSVKSNDLADSLSMCLDYTF